MRLRRKAMRRAPGAPSRPGLQRGYSDWRPAACLAPRSPPRAAGERFRLFATGVGSWPRLWAPCPCRRPARRRSLTKSPPAGSPLQLVDGIVAVPKRRALSTVCGRRWLAARASSRKCGPRRAGLDFASEVLGKPGRNRFLSARSRVPTRTVLFRSKALAGGQSRRLSVGSGRRWPTAGRSRWKPAPWAGGGDGEMGAGGVGPRRGEEDESGPRGVAEDKRSRK